MGYDLRHAGLGLAMAFLGAATPACAAETLRAYEFTATTDGPITSHSGSFSFLYDDATSTPTLQAINFSIGSTVFTTANAAMDRQFTSNGLTNLYVWGGPGGSISPDRDDFTLAFRITGPPYTSFGYNQVGSGFGVSYRGGSLELKEVAVPEPASWALMILGFGMTGAVFRRGRRDLCANA